MSASRSVLRARCVASSSRGLPGSGGLSVRRSASAASMSGLTSGGGTSWKGTLGEGVMPLMTVNASCRISCRRVRLFSFFIGGMRVWRVY